MIFANFAFLIESELSETVYQIL